PEICAETAVETLVVAIGNVADAAPDEIVTDAGTEAEALELESATTAPPEGAAAESVAVPVDAAPPVTVEGFTDTLERTMGPDAGFQPNWTTSKSLAVSAPNSGFSTPLSQLTS